MVIHRLLRKHTKRSGPLVRQGLRVYAIGDIHGRRDLLVRLHDLILEDAASHSGDKQIVYLGDYLDRGLDSKGVLDLLIQQPLPGFAATYLMGNHEQAVLEFLSNTAICESWLAFGGSATLHSYGVPFDVVQPTESDYRALQAAFARALPAEHLAFLQALEPSFMLDGYFFAHAGIRPGIAPENQHPADLLWIRDEFLDSAADHGHVIVHGHSISFEPELRGNRIGIDTGAYATGVLSCVVLEGEGQRVINT